MQVIQESDSCLMCELRQTQWYRCDLQSSGILRNVEWLFRNDVAVQPTGSIFKDQEDGTDR
jgi:hypothetical protein